MEQSNPLTAPEAALIDYDAVCQNVRAALEPARAHAISLLDCHGDVLWLSEGSMGPDEHNAVREAMEAFADPNAAPVLGFDLGVSRSAVLARALDPRRSMVGAVMFVVDTRAIARGATKLMTPKLQRALVEFAATQPTRTPSAPAAVPTPDAPAHSAAQSAAGAVPASARRNASRAPGQGAARGTPPAPNAVPPRFAQAGAVRTELSLAAPSPEAASRPSESPTPPTLEPITPSPALQRMKATVTPEVDRLHAAMRKTPIALHVQRLMPLSKGSALKRYEVLLRFKSDNAPNVAPQAMLKAAVENGLGSMIDRRVITELVGFLARHPVIWQNNEAMFSVNLTSTAVQDEHFIKFVELCLAKASLPMGTMAFEIDAATAMTLSDRISDVAAALHGLGCPLVLDDFALRTECFALLRLPGVRYVKLAPQITGKMRTDKVSQAAITAIVQMARVLGMHTVAKRTDTAAEHEWLTALGVDFVQTNSMSPPVAIETLRSD
jgi:EAL domain-containing protein (putative c-di-GMP-specific phosphodiesterase class I)